MSAPLPGFRSTSASPASPSLSFTSSQPPSPWACSLRWHQYCQQHLRPNTHTPVSLFSKWTEMAIWPCSDPQAHQRLSVASHQAPFSFCSMKNSTSSHLPLSPHLCVWHIQTALHRSLGGVHGCGQALEILSYSGAVVVLTVMCFVPCHSHIISSCDIYLK